MSENLQKIVDELSKLTVLEVAELSKMLEEQWGVSAAVAVAAAGAGAAGEQGIMFRRRPPGRLRTRLSEVYHSPSNMASISLSHRSKSPETFSFPLYNKYFYKLIR